VLCAPVSEGSECSRPANRHWPHLNVLVSDSRSASIENWSALSCWATLTSQQCVACFVLVVARSVVGRICQEITVPCDRNHMKHLYYCVD